MPRQLDQSAEVATSGHCVPWEQRVGISPRLGDDGASDCRASCGRYRTSPVTIKRSASHSRSRQGGEPPPVMRNRQTGNRRVMVAQSVMRTTTALAGHQLRASELMRDFEPGTLQRNVRSFDPSHCGRARSELARRRLRSRWNERAVQGDSGTRHLVFHAWSRFASTRAGCQSTRAGNAAWHPIRGTSDLRSGTKRTGSNLSLVRRSDSREA